MEAMARKDQAAELLREGLPPSQIAHEMGTSTAAVMQYLCLKIGEGQLRRSDIAFSLPAEQRNAIEEAIEKSGSTTPSVIARELRKSGIQANRLDLGIYIHYRHARVVLGDMYELVRTVEVRLHRFIREAFIAEFGDEQWWRSGVPDNIRAECAALLEKDPEPAEEPYCYTHLVSLREILDKRWSVLGKYLPKALLNQKKDILERLLKLNRIRNSVMHPVRNAVLTEEDFQFVRDLEAQLAELRVHTPEMNAEGTPPVIEGESTEELPHELIDTLQPMDTKQPVVQETTSPEQK
jgi:predicted transcriptional regulator